MSKREASAFDDRVRQWTGYDMLDSCIKKFFLSFNDGNFSQLTFFLSLPASTKVKPLKTKLYEEGKRTRNTKVGVNLLAASIKRLYISTGITGLGNSRKYFFKAPATQCTLKLSRLSWLMSFTVKENRTYNFLITTYSPVLFYHKSRLL